MQSDFIEKLTNRIQQPLPGLDAQMRMSPPIRGRNVVVPENARQAAVLVCLYPHEEQWHLALMKRVVDGSVHSGQISFPGGTAESYDLNFTHTALREAEEEVGIVQHEVQVLGPLTEIYIPPSNFMVYPFLAHVPHRPHFVIDPKEVDSIVEVPLTELLSKEIAGRKSVPMSGKTDVRMEVPIYTLQGNVIWGATAMMLSELIGVLEDVWE